MIDAHIDTDPEIAALVAQVTHFYQGGEGFKLVSPTPNASRQKRKRNRDEPAAELGTEVDFEDEEEIERWWAGAGPGAVQAVGDASLPLSGTLRSGRRLQGNADSPLDILTAHVTGAGTPEVGHESESEAASSESDESDSGE